MIQKFEGGTIIGFGSPFEPAWDKIIKREFVMLNPVSGDPPNQKSEAKVGYTDKYLYVAGYMYDNEPDKN